LYSFINSENDVFVEDSLKSITHQKLEGDGTSKNPYLIYDGYDMMTIHDFVSNGNEFSNKHFKVADGIKHIDLTEDGVDFIPIGTEIYSFGGILNGNKAIFNIHLDTDENYQGIFHTLGETANVFDLAINGFVRGRGYIGSLAGRNLGRITNVTNYALITSENNQSGGNDTGGITGFNAGILTGVMNYGQVTSNSSYIGGITGQNTGEINGAYNRANVSGFGNVGGIVGMNSGQITNAYNIASITATE